MSGLILEHVRVTWEASNTQYVSYKMTFWLALPSWLLKVPIASMEEAVGLFSGFQVSGLGLGFRVSGSRFQVSDSKLSVLGNSNHLLRTLISFKESSNHCKSMVRVTQTIIAKLFIYLTISCFRHNKFLEYILRCLSFTHICVVWLLFLNV